MSDSGGGQADVQDAEEFDTEPTDLQSSGDTYISHQSHALVIRVDNCKIITSTNDGDVEELEAPESEDTSKQGPKSAETSGVNSSLEVEMNSPRDSLGNDSPFESKGDVKVVLTEAEDMSQGGIFTEEIKLDSSSTGRKTRKRKETSSDDSTPAAKKSRQEENVTLDTSDTQQNFKGVTEAATVKDDEIPVLNISSTPEKTIILDDSQEFSLRIEGTSPPSHSFDDKDKTSKDSESWKSHTKEKANSPPLVYSQKSINSWSSHNNIEQNLSWSSHKGSEEVANNGECEDSDKVVLEERLVLCHMLVVDEKANNKVISTKIKAVSLVDEAVPEKHPSPPLQEKPGRLSTVSTTSHKSSSSTGSVGLPGPFPLPGHSRLSVMSTVSSSTSSSVSSRPAWDGPFLKPSAPETKPVTVFVCGCCSTVFPPVKLTSSPIMNGIRSPKLPDEEAKVKVKKTPRRPRKGSNQNSSTSRVKRESSDEKPLKELSSNSDSQACNTPTPTRPRGRPRKHRVISDIEKTPKIEEAKPVAKEKGGSAIKSAVVAAPAPSGPQSPVLAKWSDGRYYPAWMSKGPNTNQQSVRVQFCDGQAKLMPVCKVMRADVITAGCLALALNSDCEYEEILVVDVDLDGSDIRYRVERDSQTRVVEFSSIALLDSQVAELTMTDDQKAKSALNFNDLSLENILSHPRKRVLKASWKELKNGSSGRKKKRQETPEPTTPQPTTSHGQVFEREVIVDTDSSTHSLCNLNLRGHEMEPLDIECSPPEMSQYTSNKLSGYKHSKTLQFKSQKKRAETSDPEVKVNELNGPIPDDGSQLFADCVFLITYTDNVKLANVINTGTSSAESSVHGKGIVMWKDRFRTQIKKGGGRVYDTLSLVPEEYLPNTFLVTDKPCNTPLYLQCLVNNIPIYSTSLIVRSCKENLAWKELIGQRGIKRLQAGYSLTKHRYVSPRSTKPLAGKSLLLALSEHLSHLVPFWKDLIKNMGATVHVYQEGESLRMKYAAIVTDPGCEEELVEEANDTNMPLMSLVWLQQCIINGKCCPPTEHPLFKYNHSERSNSPEY